MPQPARIGDDHPDLPGSRVFDDDTAGTPLAHGFRCIAQQTEESLLQERRVGRYPRMRRPALEK